MKDKVAITLLSALMVFFIYRAFHHPKAQSPDRAVASDTDIRYVQPSRPIKDALKKSPVQISMSTAEAETSEVINPQEQIMAAMSNCVGFKGRQDVGDLHQPMKSDAFVNMFNSQFGNPEKESDRWNEWRVRSGGVDKKIRLDSFPVDVGVTKKELIIYNIDENGEKLENATMEDYFDPSEQTVSEALASGEIFEKEKSSSLEYSGGLHVSYQDKDGEVQSIEVFRDSIVFTCSDLSAIEDCRCVK